MKVLSVVLENGQDGGKEVLRGGRPSVDRKARPGVCWGPITEEKESLRKTQVRRRRLKPPSPTVMELPAFGFFLLILMFP